ncbi:RDD family protein [Thioalkalivibrio paradoxus]|uniref:Transporter n=1 Tax=Thioalkalivibrio paradoxus ARh 1 TaxID=713585 RepID=W0DKI9_9GAMM|nr:RDD family protein [Thioalkalivibrio paradoxus]AHE99109.1 transporter [Thioalkalivibrio paradoxus ARh 1]
MTNATASSDPIGLPRRFAAMVYDGVLVLALWLVLGLSFVAIGALTGPVPIPVLLAAQLVAAWAFFVWFWTRTGQTLGMQAWNLQLRGDEGGPVHPWKATLRYLVALAQWLLVLFGIYLAREYGAVASIAVTALLLIGIGLSQLHPRRLMLHDWLSGTALVRISRQAPPHPRQR